MKSLLDRVAREPVLTVDVIRRVFLAAMLLGFLALDEKQLAAILFALEGLFTWFIRTNVTPEKMVVEREQAANTAGRAEATAEIAELAAANPDPQPVTVENAEPIEVVETSAAKPQPKPRKR